MSSLFGEKNKEEFFASLAELMKDRLLFLDKVPSYFSLLTKSHKRGVLEFTDSEGGVSSLSHEDYMDLRVFNPPVKRVIDEVAAEHLFGILVSVAKRG